MKLPNKLRWLLSLSMLICLLLVSTGCSEKIVVLNPKGPIAEHQRDLMLVSTVLGCLVIIPVLLLTAVIIWRYRDKPGSKANYSPDWAHSTKLELIWWGIPIIIIATLGVITARATFALEPSKPLESTVKPITVQVTSLNWKWLFQYPEQGIATVNELVIPERVPIRFEITADSPMNSFWIPQLGGQMYAMSGMAMTLYLQADEQGTFWGSGANFTGTDFAKMNFNVEAVGADEFNQWVDQVKAGSPKLTLDGYKQLAQPSTLNTQAYSAFPKGLFEMTVTKYASSHHHGLSQQELKETPAIHNHDSTHEEMPGMDMGDS